jgi:hypothetical protein
VNNQTYPNRNRVDTEDGYILWHTDTILDGFLLGVVRTMAVTHEGETIPYYRVVLNMYGDQSNTSNVLFSWYEVLDFLKSKAEQDNRYFFIRACVLLVERINAKGSM